MTDDSEEQFRDAFMRRNVTRDEDEFQHLDLSERHFMLSAIDYGVIIFGLCIVVFAFVMAARAFLYG